MTNAISKKYEHRVHLLLISRSLETALRSDKLAHSKTVPSGRGLLRRVVGRFAWRRSFQSIPTIALQGSTETPSPRLAGDRLHHAVGRASGAGCSRHRAAAASFAGL